MSVWRIRRRGHLRTRTRLCLAAKLLGVGKKIANQLFDGLDDGCRGNFATAEGFLVKFLSVQRFMCVEIYRDVI